jgi:hypothetical protein
MRASSPARDIQLTNGTHGVDDRDGLDAQFPAWPVPPMLPRRARSGTPNPMRDFESIVERLLKPNRLALDVPIDATRGHRDPEAGWMGARLSRGYSSELAGRSAALVFESRGARAWVCSR